MIGAAASVMKGTAQFYPRFDCLLVAAGEQKNKSVASTVSRDCSFTILTSNFINMAAAADSLKVANRAQKPSSLF